MPGGRLACSVAIACCLGCTVRTCPEGRCAELGEACDVSWPCAGNLYCDEGACALRRPDGASCDGYEECISGTCVDGECRQWCSPDYACPTLGTRCVSGLCETAAPAGERCTFDEDCAEHYTCSAAQAFTCQPLCRTGDAASSCGASACCPDGTPCEPATGCAPSVYLIADACMRTSIGCEAGELCVLTSGGVRRCLPRCEQNAECPGRSLCLPDAEAPSISVCSYGGTQPYDGPCVHDLECVEGLACGDGLCRFGCDLADGEPCAEPAEPPHVCIDGACLPAEP